MMIRGMLSEVWRNVSTGTTRAVTLALTTTVVLTVFTLADVIMINRIEHNVHRFQAMAANMYKLDASDQIDGLGCDRLSEASNVQASGAVREVTAITVDQAPEVPMTTYEVSYGFGDILGVYHTQVPGVWIESELAKTLAVNPGDSLSTLNDALQVAAVFDWPNDGRDMRFGFAILVPREFEKPFDECWIQSWPIAEDNDVLLRSTLIVTSDSYPTTVSQVNRTLGISLDANLLYGERITWNAIWIGPLVLLVIGFIATWRRRLEYSANLHAGQTRSELLLGVAIESLIWVITGCWLALMVDLAVIRIVGMTQVWPVWVSCAIVVWGSLVGALFGGLSAALAIREKALFRYLNTR